MNNLTTDNRLNELSSQNKELDEFAYIVSHDLRNAARAMGDISAWVQEDVEEADLKLPEGVNDHLDLLARQSKRLTQMMEDLLIYSRIGRCESLCDISPFEILRAILKEAPADLDINVSNTLTDCRVLIGKSDLETLFGAIISNAVKHNDQTERALSISGEISNGYVTILFTDNGPGIAAEYHEKIFQMMTTLKSRDLVEGSGIGLAVCKKICEKYGGKIWIKSLPPAIGSIFGVVLPLA